MNIFDDIARGTGKLAKTTLGLTDDAFSQLDNIMKTSDNFARDIDNWRAGLSRADIAALGRNSFFEARLNDLPILQSAQEQFDKALLSSNPVSIDEFVNHVGNNTKSLILDEGRNIDEFADLRRGFEEQLAARDSAVSEIASSKGISNEEALSQWQTAKRTETAANARSGITGQGVNGANAGGPGTRFNSMWNMHKIRMAALGITVGAVGLVVADKLVLDGTLAKGAGSGVVNFGEWLKETDPELGQAIIDIVPEAAGLTMDVMGATNDAAIRATAQGLEESGHKDMANGLRIMHALSPGKIAGLFLELDDVEQDKRSAVFIEEFCKEAEIDKEELHSFLQAHPRTRDVLALTMESAGGNINDIFPEAAPQSPTTGIPTVGALTEQLTRQTNNTNDRSLTDLMNRMNISENIDQWSGNTVSKAFDFAKDNKDALQLGFFETIVMAAVGWLSKGLSGIFGNSAGQFMQRNAMSMLGVDDKLQNLTRSAERGDLVAQGRDMFGLTGQRGPSLSAAPT